MNTATELPATRPGAHVPGGSDAERTFDQLRAAEREALQRRSDQGYAATYGAPPPTLACNCEHADCRHSGNDVMCDRPAGTERIDMLGVVCNPCAEMYGPAGEYPRLAADTPYNPCGVGYGTELGNTGRSDWYEPTCNLAAGHTGNHVDTATGYDTFEWASR